MIFGGKDDGEDWPCSTDRWHDELPGEETHSREGTVGEQRQRGEGVDGGVDVGEALEPLEVAVLVAVEQWAVPAEEDLHRPQRPPQHLVETVRQIDRRRPLESGKLRHAVDRPPPAAMHLESGKDILCDRSVDPPKLHHSWKEFKSVLYV